MLLAFLEILYKPKLIVHRKGDAIHFSLVKSILASLEILYKPKLLPHRKGDTIPFSVIKTILTRVCHYKYFLTSTFYRQILFLI